MSKVRAHDNPIYFVWSHMKQRCDNPNDPNYARYGGRGITYKKSWKTFKGFEKDMGPSYIPGMTLDRMNNDGDYTKRNCRWATSKQQANNRSSSHLIRIGGIIKTLAEWCDLSEVKPSTIRQRYFVYNWPIERALGIDFGRFSDPIRDKRRSSHQT